MICAVICGEKGENAGKGTAAAGSVGPALTKGKIVGSSARTRCRQPPVAPPVRQSLFSGEEGLAIVS